MNVALVTGAGSGIGRAVALKLAHAGYQVVITGRREERLRAVAAAAVSNCHSISSDVTDVESVTSLFEQVRIRFGRLDVLFNNAGVSSATVPLEDVKLEDWHRVIATNLTGTFLCTQSAFKLMRDQSPQGGRIINNGSISSQVPRPMMVAYTASKHAVTGLTKTTSLEGRRYNIACGQIDIGNTATEMASSMSTGTLQADFTTNIEPTFDVQHVADAVLYMANLPLEANVQFMTVMATKMPFVGRG